MDDPDASAGRGWGGPKLAHGVYMVATISVSGGRPWSGAALSWTVVAALLPMVLLSLFGWGIAGVVDAWGEPEYSHGWLIPIITLFCLWQRRQRILQDHAAGTWRGTALVAAGLALLVLAWMALMQMPQAVAFIVVLAGLGLAGLGARSMRLVWLPLAFLLFALPVPGTAYLVLSTQLQHLSSQIGAWMLQALGVSVFLDGNVIDLGTFKLQVAEACSGLRYLFPLAAFGFLCAWLYRAPLWARALVFLATIPITVLTNSARIALTGVLMEYGSQELAEGFLHLFEGWIIFLVALALLFGLMWGLAKLRDPGARVADLLDFDRMAGDVAPKAAGELRAGSPQPATRGPGAPLLVSVALLVLVLPVQWWVAERTEQVPDRPGLVTFPLHLGDWTGQFAAVDGDTLAVLQADDYLLADYAGAGGGGAINLWVAYYGSQIEQGRIHSPKECLPGAGWEFTRIEAVPSPAADASGRAFVINRALISKGSERMLMYYWYEQRGTRYTDEMWTKISILRDAFVSRRSDGALVRLLTPIRADELEQDAAGRLDGFFRAMYPALEPHVGA
jgi:exosortase D (VPLPA-CTERM-specific)